MSQETNKSYKRSLSASVGAGLSSVFNAGGRNYYILEHKVSSQYHRAGEAQEIIVDQVEIGRDPKCQVQFDESFKTVSRRHAAIVRDGDNWKLVQLSQTNQTFLNGHPVANEWYLQNGDEIQLSVNGPKLGFIVPTGNKAKTGSIALSRRLSLFRQQALKPYKTAIALLAVFIVLITAGGTTWSVLSYKQNKATITNLTDDVDDANETIDGLRGDLSDATETIDGLTDDLSDARATIDDLMNNLDAAKEQLNTSIEEQNAEWEAKFKKLQKENVKLREKIQENISTNNVEAKRTIADCEASVYYVSISKIEISYAGRTQVFEDIGNGTGFLLDDGRFVTARHVVEPWLYSAGESILMEKCNAIAHNGGSVVCYLEAYSQTGDKITFNSTQIHVNRSADTRRVIDGLTYVIAPDGITDYAYFNTNKTGSGLSYDNQLSCTLPAQAKLTILGFPLGLGYSSANDIRPLYSEASVAREGLGDGMILTTATTFEKGNSGGPVFVTTTDGELIVVGVVCAIAGRSTGFVLPISAVQ